MFIGASGTIGKTLPTIYLLALLSFKGAYTAHGSRKPEAWSWSVHSDTANS